MSSLSQQLRAIGEKNASVALDRKTRSKIHLRSLIFDAKVAGAQDYDYIYQIACEGLVELEQIDPRFGKFWATLFAETSVLFDRNVQTADVLQTLQRNIEAFVNMLGAYYQVAPALKAMEWLVRRYHVNIHLPELLLVSALPHHATPVFVRFMNVVPRDQWPAIFMPLVLYKEQLKAPPALAILKCFHNDPAFFRLYSDYVVAQLRHNTVYKDQLVFYLANTAQLLASHARDVALLNDHYIPVVLEAAAAFLAPHNLRSPALAADVRLTIYAVVSVLCSVVPLTHALLVSLSRSIVQGDAFAPAVRRQTYIVLGQLWNFCNEPDLPADEDVFAALPVLQLVLSDALFAALRQENFRVSKFLFFYFVDRANHGHADAVAVLLALDPALSPFLFDSLASKLLHLLASDALDAFRTAAVGVFEKLLKADKPRLLALLQKHGKSLGDLEMVLMHTLGSAGASDTVYDADLEDVDVVVDVPTTSSRESDYANNKVTATSFFASASDADFAALTALLLSSLRGLSLKEQKAELASFVQNALPSDASLHISYLVRLALTPAIPSGVRCLALALVKENLASPTSSAYYLLVPVLLLGLVDENKAVRGMFAALLRFMLKNAEQAAKQKGKDCDLFMESQIYGDFDASKRSLISPRDAHVMMEEITSHDSLLGDIAVDSSRITKLVFDVIFKCTQPKQKKFGSVLLKSFILTQWALPSWSFVLKYRAWKIVAAENAACGSDDRFFFVQDLKQFFADRAALQRAAAEASVDFADVEHSVVNLVGGKTANDKKTSKEIEWFLSALAAEGSLQIAAKNRLVELFPHLKAETKLHVCSELVDLVVKDNDVILAFDPVEVLQSLDFSNQSMVALLDSVNIVTQIPEQGVAKRRRRSSSSTQKNMAREDISSMAATHLRKLSVILDVLESQLRSRAAQLAGPHLLQALFKILTDLDYLGNDGKMPVLYAQETLAACMLLTIVEMKRAPTKKNLALDSNHIRADLIVNSIRLSHSPQVQNRLLLVISELASLAPEIILHSVMPIFTFMGAHTIRQDDEFSSSALQQTIAKVVPAIMAASDSASNEIEFLLTSFVTAFQHIPRHRRVKLFVSLVRTLSCSQSLHTIIFLIGQQYAANAARNKLHECSSLLDFVSSLMKTFSAQECIDAISNFLGLWEAIPTHAVEKDSEEYSSLESRPIYGSSVVNLTEKELVQLKERLLHFLNQVLSSDEENSITNNVVSLKMKVALVLFDDETPEEQKELMLQSFNQVTSFILAALESFGDASTRSVSDELYELLKSLLNLLPLSHYMSSIIRSLKEVSDPMSTKVAKNFAVLAGVRFETEVNSSSIDDNVDAVVLDELLPTLVAGVEKFDNTELVQAYLDTFAVIVNKFGSMTQELLTSENAKFLVGSLKVITSEQGLLSEHPEVVVSSLSAIASIINILGVKAIGFFPKILPPALKIWESTISESEDSDSDSDEEDEEVEKNRLLQGSVLMLFSCLVKKMPAFVVSSLPQILKAALTSDLIDNSIRSSVLALVVEHVDKSQVLQALCNLALTDNIYAVDNAADLGLYLSTVRNSVDAIDKKVATAQSSLFMKWLIKSFGFRSEVGDKFNDNTIYSVESSFHECGLAYVMKLNDKNFRPLFASLVRWAITGEGSLGEMSSEKVRLEAFFRFFNKLQDNLRSIITTYFSYLLDPTVGLLKRFADGSLEDVNLRRLVLHALASSFKYDQDDYWSHQSRFESTMEPLLAQLGNIEDSIGKHLVKTLSFFITNVSSEEHNEKLVHGLVRYISNEHDNTLETKIWTIRVLKTVFHKMGEQWLSYLPTFIPYIAELLEDDDEEVEMEVRKDLVRVIENILGEPLERYLN